MLVPWGSKSFGLTPSQSTQAVASVSHGFTVVLDYLPQF